MEKDLVDYFNAMSKAFPYQDLEKIYSKNIKESIEGDAGKVLDPILKILNVGLGTKIVGHLTTTYVAGSAQMMKYGGLAFEGVPSTKAINWAEKHAAKLVTEMDEETKNRLAKVISDGIANKRGVAGIGRDIRKEIQDMSVYRGKLIAKTETATALGQAFEDNGEEMGIDGKEWVTAGDDRVSDGCRENEAAGVIPFDQAFPSGHMTPPRFPGCRCACAPAKLKR
jgi:SPP1 gp7 family putative phage head morphogenesis protein